jgi:ribonuclease-3
MRELTRLRSHLVSEPALAALARELEVGDQLLWFGELKSGGFGATRFSPMRSRRWLPRSISTAADACRDRARPVRRARAGAGPIPARMRRPGCRNCCRAAGWLAGVRLVATAGPTMPVFDVECDVSGLTLKTVGRGASRRAAEQVAATAALAQIEAAQADAG